MRMQAAPWLVGLVLTGAAAAQAYPDILYYKFNEGAGTTITNSAIPGAAVNTPVFESGVGGVWDTTTPAVGGAALDFAGMDRLISNYDTDLSNDFTIECWVRTNYTLPPGCPTPCSLGRLWGDYTSGFGAFRCYVGWYNASANFLGGGLPALNSGNNPAQFPIVDGTWHHIALVFDLDPATGTGTLTSYVDGMLDQQATGVPPGIYTGTGNFFLGGNQGVGNPFNGSVDEFRWWGVARTQAEIQANMNGEIPPPTTTTAAFSADSTSGPNPLLVRFTDLSTTSSAGGITSWAWTFGDGGTSTDQNPCHLYTQSGTYDVSLTVTSAAGSDTLTITGMISVGADAFVVASCGLGDLYVDAPPPPAGWFEGYTLLSLDTQNPVGAGWLLGLYPDSTTWLGFSFAASPGNPFHFLNTGNPALYPDAPLSFGPGSITLPTGVSMDAVVLYLDGSGILLSWTNVSRVTF